MSNQGASQIFKASSQNKPQQATYRMKYQKSSLNAQQAKQMVEQMEWQQQRTKYIPKTGSVSNLKQAMDREEQSLSNESLQTRDEALSSQQEGSNKKHNKNKQSLKTDKAKFKTEMCKNWIEVGVCRYGNKCQFAHGQRELVEKNQPLHQKYKSKDCNTFQDKLYCPYGSRCLFKHDNRNISDVQIFYYHYLVNFESKFETDKSKVKANRLDIFKFISPSDDEEDTSCSSAYLNSDKSFQQDCSSNNEDSFTSYNDNDSILEKDNLIQIFSSRKGSFFY